MFSLNGVQVSFRTQAYLDLNGVQVGFRDASCRTAYLETNMDLDLSGVQVSFRDASFRDCNPPESSPKKAVRTGVLSSLFAIIVSRKPQMNRTYTKLQSDKQRKYYT